MAQKPVVYKGFTYTPAQLEAAAVAQSPAGQGAPGAPAGLTSLRIIGCTIKPDSCSTMCQHRQQCGDDPTCHITAPNAPGNAPKGTNVVTGYAFRSGFRYDFRFGLWGSYEIGLPNAAHGSSMGSDILYRRGASRSGGSPGD